MQSGCCGLYRLLDAHLLLPWCSPCSLGGYRWMILVTTGEGARMQLGCRGGDVRFVRRKKCL